MIPKGRAGGLKRAVPISSVPKVFGTERKAGALFPKEGSTTPCPPLIRGNSSLGKYISCLSPPFGKGGQRGILRKNAFLLSSGTKHEAAINIFCSGAALAEETKGNI
jgi:hypothetical protein